MLLQLGGQVGVDVCQGVNGLVCNALLGSQNHLPEVLQSHQVQGVCQQYMTPLTHFVVVAVHMTEKAIKAMEAIVRECLRVKFHHILNEDVLGGFWLQIWLILDKLK